MLVSITQNKTSDLQEKENTVLTSTTKMSTKVSIVDGASELGENSFQPNPINIKIGETIVWTNNDSIIHTVTEGNPLSSPTNNIDTTNGFDSGLMNQGMTFQYTFSKAGNYEYYCSVHPTMIGKVTVSP